MNQPTTPNPFITLLKKAERDKWCTSATCLDCGKPHLTNAVNDLRDELGKRKARTVLKQAFRDPSLKPWEFGWLLGCASHLLGKHSRARLHTQATQLAIKSFDPDLIEALLDRIPSDWPGLSKLLSLAMGKDFSKFRTTLQDSRQARIEAEED